MTHGVHFSGFNFVIETELRVPTDHDCKYDVLVHVYTPKTLKDKPVSKIIIAVNFTSTVYIVTYDGRENSDLVSRGWIDVKKDGEDGNDNLILKEKTTSKLRKHLFPRLRGL